MTDTILHHHELLGFLRQHAPILEVLQLNDVRFPHGTWAEPLEVIENMPHLKELLLSDLKEQTPCPQSSADLLPSHAYIGTVHLFAVEQVKIAVGAVRNNLKTVYTAVGYDEQYPYVVDFEIGEAVADGKMVYRDERLVSGYVDEEEDSVEDDDDRDAVEVGGNTDTYTDNENKHRGDEVDEEDA
jgi:hypothetical protein